ncbi:hypothetical protein ANO11243_003190 [Dothideomycetidae sp. 11243]|nr:hypothetical protein ANO11243_003190 [fungal sp. No.11243]
MLWPDAPDRPVEVGQCHDISSEICTTDRGDAGGLGFIGAGNDVSQLAAELDRTRQLLHDVGPTHGDTIPVGVGLLLWGLEVGQVTSIIADPTRRPAAVWLFAPRQMSDLSAWSEGIRDATDCSTKIWIQIGTAAEAVAALEYARPDVLVVQSQDAGGHGLTKGAGLIPLLPEVIAAVEQAAASRGQSCPSFIAAGGIMDGTCAAAALALGAHGVCLGTKLLATPEANLADGYRQAVIRAKDGGVSTVRSHVYDTLRGTTSWPDRYGGRGVINASYWDFEEGMDMEHNKSLYNKALEQGDEGWDENRGRLTTYAGTGVGLVTRLQPAAEIVAEMRADSMVVLQRTTERMKSFCIDWPAEQAAGSR